MGPILIVDDEVGIVDTLADVLQEEGYRTLAARDGRQALAQMARERPALLLLDYMMPLLNGGGVLEAMGRDGALSDIPVILMSATPAQAVGDLPCEAFLAKPFELDQLLALVQDLLGREEA